MRILSEEVTGELSPDVTHTPDCCLDVVREYLIVGIAVFQDLHGGEVLLDRREVRKLKIFGQLIPRFDDELIASARRGEQRRVGVAHDDGHRGASAVGRGALLVEGQSAI